MAKHASARPTIVRAASTLVTARSPVAVRRGADGSVPLPVTTTLGVPPEEYDDEYDEEEDEMDVDDAATSVASSGGGYEDDEGGHPPSNPVADRPAAGAAGDEAEEPPLPTSAGVARGRKRTAAQASKSAAAAAYSKSPVVDWSTYLNCGVVEQPAECTVANVVDMNSSTHNRQHVFEAATVMLAQNCRAALDARRRQKGAADEDAAAAAAVPHKQPRLGRPPKTYGSGARSLSAYETASIRLQSARNLFGFATSTALKCALYAHMTCYGKASKQTVSRQWLLLTLLADHLDEPSMRNRFATGNDLLDMFEPIGGAELADHSSLTLALDTVEHDRSVDHLLELLHQQLNSLNRRLTTEYLTRRITSAVQSPPSSDAAVPSLTTVSAEPLISRLVPWLMDGLLNVSDQFAHRRFPYASNYSALAKFIDDAGYYKAIDARIALLNATGGPVPAGTVPPSLVPYEPFIEEYLSKAYVAGSSRINRRTSIVRTSQLELKNTLLQVRESMRSLNAVDRANYALNPTTTYEAFFTNTLETQVYVNEDGYKVEEIKECVVDVFSSPFNSDLNKLPWSERLRLLPQKKYVGITLRSLSGAEIMRIGAEQKWKWCIASHHDQNRGITRYSYPLKRAVRPKLAAADSAAE